MVFFYRFVIYLFVLLNLSPEKIGLLVAQMICRYDFVSLKLS